MYLRPFSRRHGGLQLIASRQPTERRQLGKPFDYTLSASPSACDPVRWLSLFPHRRLCLCLLPFEFLPRALSPVDHTGSVRLSWHIDGVFSHPLLPTVKPLPNTTRSCPLASALQPVVYPHRVLHHHLPQQGPLIAFLFRCFVPHRDPSDSHGLTELSFQVLGLCAVLPSLPRSLDPLCACQFARPLL